MSVINSHNIGGKIGETGLPLLNWSTLNGDLRVAHFFGIHSLQIIPILGYYTSKRITNEKMLLQSFGLGQSCISPLSVLP